MGEKSCEICHLYHSHPGKFPDDFPDEWKWCCGCLGFVGLIVAYGIDKIRDTFRNQPNSLRRIDLVNEMINIV